MTAAAHVRPAQANLDGLRPLNPRRDMRAVAEVIEIAFAGQLDANGRRMIRQMKTLGSLGWFGWVAAQLVLPPAAYPLGYVWQESGRVVGNVSLLPSDHLTTRWVIANVAVVPEFRRRGIARALVTAAVDLGAQRGAHEVLLQVDLRAEPAQRLYQTLGFTTQAVRTTWWRAAHRPLPASLPDPHVRVRPDADWPQHYALVRAQYPEGLVWPTPLSADIFRPERLGAALGLHRTQHWIWVDDDGHMAAALTARLGGEIGHWRYILAVSPGARGRAERPLLARALREGQAARLPVNLDHPHGQAVEALRSLDFEAERSLIWMRIGVAGKTVEVSR
jgi:ribosomal protein S18 acetylase RimI-like enzyme